MGLPDNTKVRDRADFARFVRRFRHALDRALAHPEPEYPLFVERDGWLNWWGRDAFIEATIAWLENEPWPAEDIAEAMATSGQKQRAHIFEAHSNWPPGVPRIRSLENEPIAAILLTRESGSPPANDDLAAHLAEIERWAAEPQPDASPEMWRRAACAMNHGAVYE